MWRERAFHLPWDTDGPGALGIRFLVPDLASLRYT